ncbi:MAG: alpha/beta hydrolase [Burkholderiaceae bacterium]|nr:MAG: alpha/beta hydrolase [Burkholderiaceae bacterium]
MNVHTQKLTIPGPVGTIEIAIDTPEQAAVGIALVAHPHPLFGGTLDNKVAQTLARACVQSGFIAVRPNFRGVGKTEGVHDAGNGEVDDLLATLEAMWSKYEALRNTPFVLAGFSFGAAVQARVAQRLHAAGKQPLQMILVGLGLGRFEVPNVPTNTLMIHGELDETIPLSHVLDWARPQELPVILIPGADHFFHRRLPRIRELVSNALKFSLLDSTRSPA